MDQTRPYTDPLVPTKPKSQPTPLIPPHRGPREYVTDVGYLWVSVASAKLAASKKNSSRKKDKRESVDDSSPKRPGLKDRASIRNLRSTASTFGQWKRVSITLLEQENERKETYAILSLTEEGSDMPLASLFIHYLSSTDIRVAHRSLFNRPDCLGIHHHRHPAQSAKSIPLEQTYLAFSSTEIRDTWLLILRAYTTPDIRGRDFAPTSDGGLYRVWRQLEITTKSARNLGLVNKFTYIVPPDLSKYGSNGHGGGGNPFRHASDPLDSRTGQGEGNYPLYNNNPSSSAETIDQDVFCELVLAGDICGRTSVQRTPRPSSSSPSNSSSRASTILFDESFTFSDLPQFATCTLRINVYRKKPAGLSGTVSAAAKKSMNSLTPSPSVPATSAPIPGVSSFSALSEARVPEMATSAGPVVLIGCTEISLGSLPRGESLHGSWPVTIPINSAGAGGEQVGELVLSLRVNEETILPMSKYAPIHSLLSSRNFLRVLSDLEKNTNVDKVVASEHLLSLADLEGRVVRDICEMATVEIERGSASMDTLFRATSTFTQMTERAMVYYGRPFLEASIGPIIRRMCEQKSHIETERPVGGSGPGTKELEYHGKLLGYWCQEMWKEIYLKREECPMELRTIFAHIRTQVEAKCQGSPSAELMKYKSVSAFCFLRLFGPGILYPHKFGLQHGYTPPVVQRSLKLVAKLIQSLANMKESVSSEDHMTHANNFLESSASGFIDYLYSISTIPQAGDHNPAPTPKSTDGERDRLIAILEGRIARLPTLHRESIPIHTLSLPHLVDAPKCLASIASSVVRSAREPPPLEWPSPSPSSPLSTGIQSVLQPQTEFENGLTYIEKLAKTCFEVETQALKAVSLLDPQWPGGIGPPITIPSSPSSTSTFSSPPVFSDGHVILGSNQERGRRISEDEPYGSSSVSPPVSPTMTFSAPIPSRRTSASGSGSSTSGDANSQKGQTRRGTARPSTAPSFVSSHSTESLPLRSILRSPIAPRFVTGFGNSINEEQATFHTSTRSPGQKSLSFEPNANMPPPSLNMTTLDPSSSSLDSGRYLSAGPSPSSIASSMSTYTNDSGMTDQDLLAVKKSKTGSFFKGFQKLHRKTAP